MKQVILDHDGSIDDFLSILLLLTMKDVELRAISITPADCYIENALETTLKLLKKSGKEDISVGIGGFHGINAFPSEWRARPKIINSLPSLINVEVSHLMQEVNHSVELIHQKVMENAGNVTFVLTGPCSNLVMALERFPEIGKKIDEIVWMAGAFEVPGNVVTYNHSGHAEWNVFWDPISAKKLIDHNIPITFVPLDVTNEVPVSHSFLKRLATYRDNFWVDLAAQLWAMTVDIIPSYEYIYFMWDVLATSYVSIPGAFATEDNRIDIHTKGPKAGKTFLCDDGVPVKIARNVDKEVFYGYVIESFTSLKVG